MILPAKSTVRLEVDCGIAVVTIDNPPINAGSLDVRQGLLEAVSRIGRDPAIIAAVLVGAGKTFIAGADLREFGQPLSDPQLPAVIAAIEACPKPIVAALHGVALGGGLELALGCDSRVAAAGTLVGLPEVTLGIIPGAGGTQRLPRLTGLANAIEIICSGRRIPADEARTKGILDAVVSGDVLAAGVAEARALAGRKRRVIERQVLGEAPSATETAVENAVRKGRGRPAVLEAVHCIRAAGTMPTAEALRLERDTFQRLRMSREAFALRHLFFAERDASKHPLLTGISSRPTARVAVVGAGTMGSGIAVACLDAGYETVLIDTTVDGLERGNGLVQEDYRLRVGRGVLSAAESAARMSRLTTTLDIGGLSEADLVIEAVFEDLALKLSVFREIDAVARPGAILATNTSYLDVDAIAAVTSRPQDVLGLHFFSPARVMKLLELVRGKLTSDEALVTGRDFAKRLGKIVVVARNGWGFIGNRIYNSYRRQCEFMLEEGCLPKDVDMAMESFGFAMGPFAVADLTGLDIAWRVRQQMAEQRDPRVRYCEIPDMLCEMGRLGRKSGAGYYAYSDSARRGEPDAAVAELIRSASARKGMKRRAFTADEIQRRALLAMVNEASLVLEDGIAERASDIDVVMANGYGFPKWEGGPVFWARNQDDGRLSAEFDRLAELSGPQYRRGDFAVLR